MITQVLRGVLGLGGPIGNRPQVGNLPHIGWADIVFSGSCTGLSAAPDKTIYGCSTV
jgi:hypothetical protein